MFGSYKFGRSLEFNTIQIEPYKEDDLSIYHRKPVKVGDQIRMGDISGFVEDIHILSTIARTYDGIYIRISNEKAFSSEIINFVANPMRWFEYTIGISYSDDATKK